MRVGILEKLPILHTELLLHVRSYANEAVTSLLVGKLCVMARRPEQIPIFRIFPLEYLSAFSRLDNKRGGIF